MRLRFGSLLLATAGGAAAAILAAPNAVADDCGDQGPQATDIVCSTPGNVQINDSLPVYDEGFMSGMYGGPYPVPFAEGGI